MKFGINVSLITPKPWDEQSELRVVHEALAQVEHADRLGFDYVWAQEHHFLDEYAHSSAPEVFLAAAAARTERIRLGHGIVLLPPKYNHPARVAERIGMLDLISNGRVDFGTGESGSRGEMEGFGVEPDNRRSMWTEVLPEVLKMMWMQPYPGHEGEHFSMPMRNVIPKPLQQPHPPVWVAASNRETIKLAARLGIGVLCFAFIDPDEAKFWVEEYYEIFKNECVPVGEAVNPNIAIAMPFMVHENADEARRRGGIGSDFFRFSLAHHYQAGRHRPGRSDIFGRFQEVYDRLPDGMTLNPHGVGTPDEVRDRMEKFTAVGIDQSIFIQQTAGTKHEHIMESLELFGQEVIPGFAAKEEERERAKAEDLAPFVQAAFERKTEHIEQLADEDVPGYDAYGFQVLMTTSEVGNAPGDQQRFELMRQLRPLFVEE